jgi:hypothetical protein
MNAFKIGWSLSIITLTVSLLGCQSSSQDPVKSYSNIPDAKSAYNTNAVITPPPPVVIPPPPDNTQFVCTEPFKVSVTNDRGSNLLSFTETQQASYEITVRSMMGNSFRIETANLSPTLTADFHAGRASFTLKSQTGNVATYNFSWKPGKNSGNQPDIEGLTLRYTSDAAKICGNDISETLNLLVLSQTSVDTGTTTGAKP